MYAEYAKAADIVSFDIYPTNSDNPDVKDKLWMVCTDLLQLEI